MTSSGQFIRMATLKDIEFIREICREKYPERVVNMSEPWMRGAIQNPERLVLVGQNSVAMAQVDWLYGCDRRARLAMMASRTRAGSLEVLHMLRIMVIWGKEKGAKSPFTLDADLQTGVDFGPFSERLGGKRVDYVKYHIPFED